MKVLAVLLCALVAVQARSSGVVGQSRELAALGDTPYLVHLRFATRTGGSLLTCAGSLISSSWVLTTESCVIDSSFVWVRYGVINVVHPQFVTESSTFSSTSDFGLVSINRVIETTDNIAPISPTGVEIPSSGKLCSFGGDEIPGELLSCFDITLAQESNFIIATSDEGSATRFDIGTPLVSDGEQVAILVRVSADNAGEYLAVAPALPWIEEETGLSFA